MAKKKITKKIIQELKSRLSIGDIKRGDKLFKLFQEQKPTGGGITIPLKTPIGGTSKFDPGDGGGFLDPIGGVPSGDSNAFNPVNPGGYDSIWDYWNDIGWDPSDFDGDYYDWWENWDVEPPKEGDDELVLINPHPWDGCESTETYGTIENLYIRDLFNTTAGLIGNLSWGYTADELASGCDAMLYTQGITGGSTQGITDFWICCGSTNAGNNPDQWAEAYSNGGEDGNVTVFNFVGGEAACYCPYGKTNSDNQLIACYEDELFETEVVVNADTFLDWLSVQGETQDNFWNEESASTFYMYPENWAPFGVVDPDPSSIYIETECPGCTYTDASNYSSEPTIDDGSCIFTWCATPFMNGDPDDTTGESAYFCNIFPILCNNSQNGEPNILTIFTPGLEGIQSLTDNGDCEYHGCTDSNFDGYVCNHPTHYVLCNDSDGNALTAPSMDGVVNTALGDFTNVAADCGLELVYGCTNDAYLEYYENSTVTVSADGLTYTGTSAGAVVDDGSCATLIMLGCMNEDADNYDVDATVDNGLCEFEGCYTIGFVDGTPVEPVNYAAPGVGDVDDGSCYWAGCNSSFATDDSQMGSISYPGVGLQTAVNDPDNADYPCTYDGFCLDSTNPDYVCGDDPTQFGTAVTNEGTLFNEVCVNVGQINQTHNTNLIWTINNASYCQEIINYGCMDNTPGTFPDVNGNNTCGDDANQPCFATNYNPDAMQDDSSTSPGNTLCGYTGCLPDGSVSGVPINSVEDETTVYATKPSYTVSIEIAPGEFEDVEFGGGDWNEDIDSLGQEWCDYLTLGCNPDSQPLADYGGYLQGTVPILTGEAGTQVTIDNELQYSDIDGTPLYYMNLENAGCPITNSSGEIQYEDDGITPQYNENNIDCCYIVGCTDLSADTMWGNSPDPDNPASYLSMNYGFATVTCNSTNSQYDGPGEPGDIGVLPVQGCCTWDYTPEYIACENIIACQCDPPLPAGYPGSCETPQTHVELPCVLIGGESPTMPEDGNGEFIMDGEALEGCTDDGACNPGPYFNYLQYDDGSFDYSCSGCTDPSATNYEPDATMGDPGDYCDYEYIFGCMDPDAVNYHPQANVGQSPQNDTQMTFDEFVAFAQGNEYLSSQIPDWPDSGQICCDEWCCDDPNANNYDPTCGPPADRGETLNYLDNIGTNVGYPLTVFCQDGANGGCCGAGNEMGICVGTSAGVSMGSTFHSYMWPSWGPSSTGQGDVWRCEGSKGTVCMYDEGMEDGVCMPDEDCFNIYSDSPEIDGCMYCRAKGDYGCEGNANNRIFTTQPDCPGGTNATNAGKVTCYDANNQGNNTISVDTADWCPNWGIPTPFNSWGEPENADFPCGNANQQQDCNNVTQGWGCRYGFDTWGGCCNTPWSGGYWVPTGRHPNGGEGNNDCAGYVPGAHNPGVWCRGSFVPTIPGITNCAALNDKMPGWDLDSDLQ